MEKNINDILKEIKQIDNNVSSVIVPILKDTIEDYRKVVFRLIAVICLLIIGLCGISVYAIYKYNNFLSQFEYEGYEIGQDLDTTDGGDIINPVIENNR